MISEEPKVVTAKVSFLVPDISAPSIGAALKLAKYLEPEFETEIIGPDFGRGICSLYRNSYPFTSIPAGRLYRLPDYWWESSRIASRLSGDVIIAVKGFASTVPIALKSARRRRVPVAVYLDEWDGAMWHAMTLGEKAACWIHNAHHPMEPCFHPFIERSIRRANTVLSTTSWLQKRFGGHVVHAGADCDFFRPQPPADVAALKASLGLDGCRVIVFGGVVRPHKGVEEILEALVLLNRDDIRVLVVGPITEHLDIMMRSPRYGRFITVAGDAVNSATDLNAKIHKRMPLYLDVGELVVLPLRDTLLAQTQMPIKVFEALAMGKPVIGTAVSDLPDILDGCGWIVPPDNASALADAIAYALDHPDELEQRGIGARDKCVNEFSAGVCAERLRAIVRDLLDS